MNTVADALWADLCGPSSTPDGCTVTHTLSPSGRRRLVQNTVFTASQRLNTTSNTLLTPPTVDVSSVASALNLPLSSLSATVVSSTAEITVTVISEGSADSSEASKALATQQAMPNALATVLGIPVEQIAVVAEPSVTAPPKPPPPPSAALAPSSDLGHLTSDDALSSSPPSSPPSSSETLIAIVAGVAGGLVACLAAVALWRIWRCRRERQASKQSVKAGSAVTSVKAGSSVTIVDVGIPSTSSNADDAVMQVIHDSIHSTNVALETPATDEDSQELADLQARAAVQHERKQRHPLSAGVMLSRPSRSHESYPAVTASPAACKVDPAKTRCIRIKPSPQAKSLAENVAKCPDVSERSDCSSPGRQDANNMRI